MNRILTRLGWAFLVLLVLLLAGLVTARVMFTRYLHSDAFRRSLGEGAANGLHASRAEFSPLEFDGSLVYGENFKAEREDGGGFSSIDADQLRASFDWRGLLRHTVQIDEMSVQRIDVEPPVNGAAPEIAPGVEATPAPLGSEQAGWKMDLRKLVITELNWHWSEAPSGGVTGAALTMTPDGGNAWIIDAQGGTVEQGGWPSLSLETASMRWQSPTLFINSASLHNGSSQVSVTGSVETRRSVDLDVKLESVDVHPLLTPDWREKVSGRLIGLAKIRAPLGNADEARAVTISGSASLIDGELTALPILDQIGAFTHTERFRRLELTRASADFTHTADHLEVSNLIVESEGLIRVEGTYTVRNGIIDGTFQVGLTPATLQWIPGSQDQVFIASRGGYRWTTMRLSGPVDHPDEDLTARLAVAAGTGVIQGTEGTVKKAAEGVLDLLLR